MFIKKIRYIFLFLFSISQLIGFSQQKPKAKLYAKNENDTISLRWIVTDFDTWERSIELGYDLFRKNIKTGKLIKVNDSIIRPLKPFEWAKRNTVFIDSIGQLKKNIDKNSMMALAYQFPKETDLVFDMPENKKNVDFGDDPRKTMHLFHSVACLNSKEAAFVSGLIYKDSKIIKNTDYEYFLCEAGQTIRNKLSSVTINSSDIYPKLKLKVKSDRTNKKVSFLFWDKPDTANAVVASYLVFRSKRKDGGFIKITKTPLLALTDPYEIKNEPVIFNDQTLEKGKTYFYKIQAIDIFGDLTDFSEPYMVTEKTLLSSTPTIIETKTSANFKNTITWTIKDYEKENISAFYIYRNNVNNKMFDFYPISDELNSNTRSFIDNNPINSNFYKIMAIGKANDTVWSNVKLVSIPDSIPPKIPVIKSAICDSLGIVTIIWEHGNEEDLEQFNIYTANYINEEYSRIANIGVDTMFIDTISLGVLDKSVFYKIVALDKIFNPSEFSEPFEAIRYDTIPPNPPVITEIESNEKGIYLRWGCSSSIDLKQTQLKRKLKDGKDWKIIETFLPSDNDYRNYTDTTVIKDKKYKYTLIAIDEFGLKSQEGRILEIQALDNGKKAPIKDFTANLHKRKHTVKLQWKYPYSGVEKFLIYRTLNSKNKSIITNVVGNKHEYYDEKTGQGNKYEYQIKAIFINGAESPLSKILTIEY